MMLLGVCAGLWCVILAHGWCISASCCCCTFNPQGFYDWSYCCDQAVISCQYVMDVEGGSPSHVGISVVMFTINVGQLEYDAPPRLFVGYSWTCMGYDAPPKVLFLSLTSLETFGVIPSFRWPLPRTISVVHEVFCLMDENSVVMVKRRLGDDS